MSRRWGEKKWEGGYTSSSTEKTNVSPPMCGHIPTLLLKRKIHTKCTLAHKRTQSVSRSKQAGGWMNVNTAAETATEDTGKFTGNSSQL